MSVELRLPNITAQTQAGQLAQLKSYLYQMTEQLNWALKNVEAGVANGYVVVNGRSVGGSMDTSSGGADAVVKFNEIKSLIIKSADIVNAYYDVISTRLEGEYVAQSEFGTFSEQTSQDIEANSTGIESIYSDIQQITTDIENVEHTLIEVNAHIKSGLLYYDDDGAPVYGLEIGQRNEIDGEDVFNKYARFTSEKLAFYDQNDNEVAYISDRKLYITYVEVTGAYKIGGFVDTVMADGRVVTRWTGGG